MRYNIALIPEKTSAYEPYVQCAQQNFGTIHKYYLLGEKSIPHVTLCQFEGHGDMSGLAKVMKKLEAIYSGRLFNPVFMGLNFLKLTAEFSNLYSVELLVHRDQALSELHDSVTSMVTELGLVPLNAHASLYRPHLTLACLAKPDSVVVPRFPQNLLGTPDSPFVVKLGVADDYWQFVKSVLSL